MSRAARILLAALAAGLAPGARAEVLVLSQASVPQYAEVAAAFAEVRKAPVVDVSDEGAVKGALERAPDVIVAIGSKALEVARARGGRAAIVAAAVVGQAADVPGVGMEARAQDAVRALHALAPRARKVAVLHAPGATAAVHDARAAARAGGLDATFHPIVDLAGFQDAFRGAADGQDAVWILPDPRLARPDVVKFMVTTCIERRVALVGFLDGMTRTGALLSVAADFRAIGREAARVAADVEAHPGSARSTPLRFAPGKLSVNDRVREMLGLAGRPPEGAEIVR